MLNSDPSFRVLAKHNYNINEKLNSTSLNATMTEEEAVSSNKTRLLNKRSTAEIVGILNEKVFKLQDERLVKSEYEKYQKLDIAFGIAAIIPMIFTVITCDLEFTQANPVLLNVLLYLTFSITLLSIGINIARYRRELKYMKAINAIEPDTNLVSSGQIYYLLLEIAVLMVIPYPWTANYVVPSYDEDDLVSFSYMFNDLFAVGITLRIFFIIRMILHLGSYMSPTVVRLSYFYGTQNGYTYAVKCLMRRYPLMTVLINYLSSIIIFAYMLRICERPLDNVPGESYIINGYWNAVWYVIATMTTVGYGDFYARTNFGRLVSFFCCTWGAVIISLMVVVLTSVLEMSDSEKKILIIMERLQLKRKLKVKAANLITSVAKLIFINAKKRKMGIEINEEEKKEWTRRMEFHLKGFKQHSTLIKRLNDRDNTNEEMSRQFEFMRHEMKEIKQAIGDLAGLVQKSKTPEKEVSTATDINSKAGI